MSCLCCLGFCLRPYKNKTPIVKKTQLKTHSLKSIQYLIVEVW